MDVHEPDERVVGISLPKIINLLSAKKSVTGEKLRRFFCGGRSWSWGSLRQFVDYLNYQKVQVHKMVGKWLLWMKQYIPRDEQGITVKIVVYKLLRVVVVPLLPGTVCLLLSHWAALYKSDTRGESMGANL